MNLPKTMVVIVVLGVVLPRPHQCTASAYVTEQTTAIKRLQFLVGTWKSVAEPGQAAAAPEIRTIKVCPDGRALTATTGSVLGKQRPVQITFEPKTGTYVFTSTTSDGDELIFNAELIAEGKLEIPIPPQSSGLFSGFTFIVTVNDGEWTEILGLPSMETFFRSTASRLQEFITLTRRPHN